MNNIKNNNKNNWCVTYKRGLTGLTDGTNSIESPDMIQFPNNLMVGQVLTPSFEPTDNFTIGKIIGQLHLSSKIIYSCTNKKYIKKDFTPLFNIFPKILVRTTKNKLQSDLMVVIHIESYDSDTGCYVGVVDEYLGEIDKIPNNEFIKYLSTSHWTKKVDKIPNEIVDLTPNRIIVDDPIYSVDPIGCIDIDDAIGIKMCDSNICVQIHIADVSSYIEENSLLDIELGKRCQSVYSSFGPTHMIPQDLSINHISLKSSNCIHNLRAFTVEILFDPEYNILETKFFKSSIKKIINLSYEEAQQMVQSKSNNDVSIMYDIGQQILSKHYASSFDLAYVYDTHIMVEVYMLLVNNMVAKKLAEYDEVNALVRAHNSKINRNTIISDELVKLNTISRLEKAYYKIGAINSEHVGLDIKFYTHFSSPMRRYADICVHRQLYKCLNNIPLDRLPSEQIFRMNYYNKLYKDIQNYENMLNCIDKIQNDNRKLEAYVYDLEYTYVPIIRIHIPSLNLNQNVKLCESKILGCYEIHKKDHMIWMKNKLSNKIFQIQTFDKIRINISISLKSMNKINICIDDYFLVFNL